MEVQNAHLPELVQSRIEDLVNVQTVDEEMATQALSQQMGKPCLVVQLDAAASTETATDVLAWLRDHGIETLNVAGPRESRRPGIHNLTGELLQAVNLASHRG